MVRSFLLLGLVLSVVGLGAERVRFIPSNASVKAVILQYLPMVLEEKYHNPRVELIREVHKQFPKLEILLTSEIPVSELWKLYPDLRPMISRAVHLPAEGNQNNIQDPFEFGWDYEHNRLAIFKFGFPDFEPVLSLWNEKTIFDVPMKEKPEIPVGQRTAGGNFEVLPDGTPVVGNNAARDAVDFFRRFSKDVVIVDSDWTGSGDLDEIFLWTKDPLGRASCILFHADVEAGFKLITKDSVEAWIQEHKRSMFEFLKKLLPDLSEDFVENPKNSAEENLAKSVKQQIMDTKKSLSEGQQGISDIQKRIGISSNHLMAANGMKGCRRITIPVIYSQGAESGRYSMLFNNPLNSLVIDNQVFSLEPDFPAERREAKRIFGENGFGVHWFSSMGFNMAGGNMHCNINTIRVPLSDGGQWGN